MAMKPVFSSPTDPWVLAARVSSIGPTAPIDAQVPGNFMQTFGANFTGMTAPPQTPPGFMQQLHQMGMPEYFHRALNKFWY